MERNAFDILAHNCEEVIENHKYKYWFVYNTVDVSFSAGTYFHDQLSPNQFGYNNLCYKHWMRHI